MKLNNRLLAIGGIILFVVLFLNKERFTDFHHRSQLASTFWLTEPDAQFTFQDLVLQYPDHYDYFKNACGENTPNNAELCRYHKHRFDPSQM